MNKIITNYTPLLAAFNLASIYLLLGGGIGGAIVLFTCAKVVGNILFADETTQDKSAG